MNLFYDNKVDISTTHDLVKHDKTKHVEIDRHFIKDHIKSGRIYITFVQTKYQLANIFTKGLSSAHFSNIVDKLGMIDIYSPA